MLSGLRHGVCRTLLQTRRGFATSTESANAMADSALEAMNSILNGEPFKFTPTSTSTASATPPAPAPRKLFNTGPPSEINIPPAEDPLLAYLTAIIQRHGYRQKAARTTTRVLLHIHTLTRAPPLPILRHAVQSVAPAIRNISNKHAGKTVVYPVPLSEKQRTRIALTWILQASENKSGHRLEERLAREIIAVCQGAGKERPDEWSVAYKKKEEVHKYAMMNRGNAGRRA
ncbi:mitochondrial ribosomal protein S5/S7 [Wolfiporia cocos MD-104 SS10]|uniref:Mitochondrial ribosomal protein S5/S7 n=1 Tax=Wolfiporia cocos (strain MD-104) TaxID=742152 RepID=A0A2H3K8N6_WOLCO|nr:mitochondrial ribosomal protein S5/S7 [Wolfiporia cocos MD-104 SS10]